MRAFCFANSLGRFPGKMTLECMGWTLLQFLCPADPLGAWFKAFKMPKRKRNSIWCENPLLNRILNYGREEPPVDVQMRLVQANRSKTYLGLLFVLSSLCLFFLEGSFLLSSRGWIVDAIGYPFFELKLCLV